MKYDFFEMSKDESGVGLVRLHRPPVNAFTLDMAKELERLVEDVLYDDGIKAVVVAGSPKAFSAGADIEMMREGGWPYLKELVAVGQRTFERIETMPKVVVAAIEGHCLGGGFEFALACDRRVMGAGRGRIGLPEVKLGLIPAWGTSYRLPRLIGKSKALDFMIRGDAVVAEEALQLGIVDEVCPQEEVVERAMGYASSIAGGALVAIASIKKLIHDSFELSFGKALGLESSLQESVHQTEDFKEGLSAFLEKRRPVFQGK